MTEPLIQDPVLNTLVTELRARLGTRLTQVWLFGSRARGDAREDSDYDVLVIVEGDVKDSKEQVQEAGWACMERLGHLVACIVYTPEQWNQRKHSPLGWMQKEGKVAA